MDGSTYIYTERHIESAFIIVIVDQGRKKIMAGGFSGQPKKNPGYATGQCSTRFFKTRMDKDLPISGI